MKILIRAGLILSLIFCVLFAETAAFSVSKHRKHADTANEILKKVSDRLQSAKSLKYNYRRELNYASEGYKNVLVADSLLDFTSVDKIIGFRYQFSDRDSLQVFNGSEKFETDKNKKLIKIDSAPSRKTFESLSFFYNSPVTLRNALPDIISDAAVPKTVTEKQNGNQSFYEIEFSLDKKTINALGGYFSITQDRKIIYHLTVKKDDYLPVEVLQTNSVNQDFIKTNFDNIQANSAAGNSTQNELTWYFSSYLNEYKIEKPVAKTNTLIVTGQLAPDWSLPVFGGSQSVSLSQFKGKLVMLEFWISHCGYCIAAVPMLNELSDKYKNKNFKLLAINAHDTPEVMNLFHKNNKPVYEMLSAGEKVSGTYGVDAYPTIVLIDKQGNVIYSGSLDKELLMKLIDKNLP